MAKKKVSYGDISLASVVIGLVIGVVAGYGLRSLQSSSAQTQTVSGASISLATSNPTPPKLGSVVTFNVTVPKLTGVKNPSINIGCYQGTTFVWGDVAGLTDQYKLGGTSSPWAQTGGSATCTANLVNIFWKHGMEQVDFLASTTFTAN